MGPRECLTSETTKKVSGLEVSHSWGTDFQT
jgi:hypothetical protein